MKFTQIRIAFPLNPFVGMQSMGNKNHSELFVHNELEPFGVDRNHLFGFREKNHYFFANFSNFRTIGSHICEAKISYKSPFMNAPIRIPASMNPLHNGHLEACKIISRETGSPLFIDIQTQADTEESFDLALRKQMVLDSFEGIIPGVSVGQSEIYDLDVKQYSGIALGSDQFNAFIKAVLQSPDPHPKRMKFLSFDMIFIVPRPDYPLVADWQEVLNTHGYASNIMHILPNSEIPMSSTWLRARLRQSGVESIVDCVPKAVYDIIKGIQDSSLAVPCERLFAQEIKQ